MANGYKLTVEAVERALRKHHGILQPAADVLGVCRDGLAKFIERNPSLKDVRQQAKEAFVDGAEGALASLVSEKHPGAVMFTLRTMGRHRGYVERNELAGQLGIEVREMEPVPRAPDMQTWLSNRTIVQEHLAAIDAEDA